jgi:hypothetical protein
MNTASPAEPVLRCLRVETVGRQVVFPTEKDEVIRCCYEVDEALLGTDGTIALEDLEDFDPNFEADGTAMAATLIPGLG